MVYHNEWQVSLYTKDASLGVSTEKLQNLYRLLKGSGQPKKKKKKKKIFFSFKKQ